MASSTAWNCRLSPRCPSTAACRPCPQIRFLLATRRAPRWAASAETKAPLPNPAIAILKLAGAENQRKLPSLRPEGPEVLPSPLTPKTDISPCAEAAHLGHGIDRHGQLEYLLVKLLGRGLPSKEALNPAVEEPMTHGNHA